MSTLLMSTPLTLSLFDAQENGDMRTNDYGPANTHVMADDTLGQQNNEVAKVGICTQSYTVLEQPDIRHMKFAPAPQGPCTPLSPRS